MGSEARTAFRFLFVSLAVLVFGMVYEVFSHGVYSKFMIFAFVFPLVGAPCRFSASLWQERGSRQEFSRLSTHSA